MVNATSSIKRIRRTNSAIVEIKNTMKKVCADERPMTCRQLYYQLVARQLIDKTQQQYQTVCRYLVQMRRDGEIPYDWIADNTRWVRRPRTWNSLESALRQTTDTYRRMLWNDQRVYVEVWCESDSIAGVIAEITREWDVGLYALRGFGNGTFLYSVAESIAEESRPCFIYYFGDYDPSGVHIDRDAERKRRMFAPDTEITVRRVAVTKQQILDWELPGIPQLKRNPRINVKSPLTSVAIGVPAPPEVLDRRRVEQVTPRDEVDFFSRDAANVRKCDTCGLASYLDVLNISESFGSDLDSARLGIDNQKHSIHRRCRHEGCVR